MAPSPGPQRPAPRSRGDPGRSAQRRGWHPAARMRAAAPSVSISDALARWRLAIGDACRAERRIRRGHRAPRPLSASDGGSHHDDPREGHQRPHAGHRCPPAAGYRERRPARSRPAARLRGACTDRAGRRPGRHGWRRTAPGWFASRPDRRVDRAQQPLGVPMRPRGPARPGAATRGATRRAATRRAPPPPPSPRSPRAPSRSPRPRATPRATPRPPRSPSADRATPRTLRRRPRHPRRRPASCPR